MLHSDIERRLHLSVRHKRHDNRVFLGHLSDKIDAFEPESAVISEEVQECVGLARCLHLAAIRVLTVEHPVIPREDVVQESLELERRHTLEVLQESLLNVLWLEVICLDLAFLRGEKLFQEHHVKLGVGLF